MKALKFRHELKHYINIADYYAIRSRLQTIAQTDRYGDRNGVYKIRSLYFDTPENKALIEKLNGVNHREKFRLRCYNDDPSFIKLEKKSKISGLCTKQTAQVTQEESMRLLEGDTAWMLLSDQPVCIELYAKMKNQLLRPKTIVDYLREAYIFQPGNVRITIDRNIRSGLASRDFFNEDLPTLSAQQTGTIVLEVKFDNFLPEIIQDLIQTNTRRPAAISKYALCRIYG